MSVRRQAVDRVCYTGTCVLSRLLSRSRSNAAAAPSLRSGSLRTLLPLGQRHGRREMSVHAHAHAHARVGHMARTHVFSPLCPISLGREMSTLNVSPISSSNSSEEVSESAEEDAAPAQEEAAAAVADSPVEVSEEANALARSVEGKTVEAINEWMSKLTTKGKAEEAIAIYDAWKSLPDSKPDLLTHNFRLHALLRTGAGLNALNKGFKEMVNNGVKPNIFTYNVLLRAAFRERNSFAAEDVLRSMDVTPDADSYNLVISACAIDRRVGMALEHMQAMLRSGFLASKSTYNEVLVNAARLRRTRDALAVLKELKAQSIPAVPTTLMDLLFASCESEDSECCRTVLDLMAAHNLKVDQGSILLALNLAARTGNVTLADQAWIMLTSYVDQPRPMFHLARIHAASSAGHFSQAFAHLKVLESQLHTEEGSSQTELLCPLSSLKPLTASLSRGVGVLDNAYYLLADHHSSAERVPQTELETSSSSTAESLPPPQLVSRSALNCVIAGCSSVRDMERAQQTFEEMQPTFQLEPDLHSFNALMEGYAHIGQAAKVEKLFADLTRLGMQPSATSHSLRITAFLSSKQAQRALDALKEMEACGHIPSREILLQVFRRCKREAFPEGMMYAAEVMQRVGYRPAHAGEGRRKFLVDEVSAAFKNGYNVRYRKGEFEDSRDDRLLEQR